MVFAFPLVFNFDPCRALSVAETQSGKRAEVVDFFRGAFI